MNKLNIEESIRRSIAEDTPDLFDKIAAAPVQHLESADYILKSRPKATPSRMRFVYAACTSFALFFAICFGLISNYVKVNEVSTLIALDVNPSVQISANRNDKVLSVKAMNPDAETLIANKDYEKKDYNEVVISLMNSMASEGYINDKKSSVLVFVSNSDETKANFVKASVVTDIKDTLTEKEIDAVVYNQTVSDTKDLEELAKQYHISFGKMKFINELVEKDSSLSIEELAKLSLQEISSLVNDKKIDITDVVQCDNNKTQLADKKSAAKSKTTATTAVTTTNDDPNGPEAIPKDPTSADPASTQDATGNPAKTDTSGNSAEGTQEAIPGTTSADNTQTPQVTQGSTATGTTSATTELGVAIAKAGCPYCSDTCNCPNCTKHCKQGCTSCDKTCPNKKSDNGSSTAIPGQPTKPSTTEKDEDGEILDEDDLGTSSIPNTTNPEGTTNDMNTSSVPDSSTNDQMSPDNAIDESTESIISHIQN